MRLTSDSIGLVVMDDAGLTCNMRRGLWEDAFAQIGVIFFELGEAGFEGKDLCVLVGESRTAKGFMLEVAGVFGTGQGEEFQGGELEGLGYEMGVLGGDGGQDGVAVWRV